MLGLFGMTTYRSLEVKKLPATTGQKEQKTLLAAEPQSGHAATQRIPPLTPMHAHAIQAYGYTAAIRYY